MSFICNSKRKVQILMLWNCIAKDITHFLNPILLSSGLSSPCQDMKASQILSVHTFVPYLQVVMLENNSSGYVAPESRVIDFRPGFIFL